MSLAVVLIVLLASAIAVIAASYVVETLRPVPKKLERLAWATGLAIEYADLGGTNVRYIKTGTGPNLVLLHTLRTQLDTFEK